MNRQPIVVRVSKKYAALFYILALGGGAMLFFKALNGNISSIERWVFMAVVILVFGLCTFGLWSLSSRQFKYIENTTEVINYEWPAITITEQEIICTYFSGKTEKVNWDEISMIKIHTTDEGPALCDVYIILADADGKGVAIPQDNLQSKIIVDRILKLPGFNYETFIAAMGSTENKTFMVWQRNS